MLNSLKYEYYSVIFWENELWKIVKLWKFYDVFSFFLSSLNEVFFSKS